jgi:hypothetical protein
VNKDVHNCIIHKYKKWLQERPIKMLMTGFWFHCSLSPAK